MTTDYHLEFIRRKLDTLKTATMHNLGNQALRLPNDVIHLLKVDDQGQLWFAGHQPRGWIYQYDQCFPVRLCFYQKGSPYFIEASGNAFFSNNEERMMFADELQPGSILFKMTASAFEYNEPGSRTSASGFFKWTSTLSHWIAKAISFQYVPKSKWSKFLKTKALS